MSIRKPPKMRPKSAEHVLYRHTFAVDPPEGVELPEPLSAPRTGWRSRR